MIKDIADLGGITHEKHLKRWVEPTHWEQTEFTIRILSVHEEPHYGKYGMIRKTYLKEHRPVMYSLYMLEDRLTEHLNAVDDEAQERMDILVRQMMEKQGVTEELKARDQMVWVGAVNNIRNVAEEIVLKELVYI